MTSDASTSQEPSSDLLARARKDSGAQEMVRLMRTIADGMETGEAWEDDDE
jgi:hypothetical protein